MIAVVQRVDFARITVNDAVVAMINEGICILLGIEAEDSDDDIDKLITRIFRINFFADNSGKFKHNLISTKFSVLVVPQFTLLGDTRKGRTPDFIKAMKPSLAKVMFDEFCTKIEGQGSEIKKGIFGAHMHVELSNNGPVTFILNSKNNAA